MTSEWRCRAPDVVAGTWCLPNTNGRCTWCGRPMKDSRQPSDTLRKFRRKEREHESTREFGTDPLGWLEGPDDDS